MSYPFETYSQYPIETYNMYTYNPYNIPYYGQYVPYVPYTVQQNTYVETTQKNKKDKRCYTCKPRGKVKQHIISETTSFIFHHDMHKRPIILVTPKRHITLINELTKEEHEELFKEIKEFATFWNIDDYQISYNVGNWQKHSHFHVKIKICEKIANRMRRDHFQCIKLDSRYKQNTSLNK